MPLKVAKKATVFALFTSLCANIALSKDISDIEGCYEVGSRCWTFAENGADVVDCDSKDRMSIKRLSNALFEIRVNSYQNNGHSCHINGVGSLIENGIVIPESGMRDVRDGDSEKGVILHFVSGHISFSYFSKSGGSGDTYCGARAILTEASFSLEDKVTTAESADCYRSTGF